MVKFEAKVILPVADYFMDPSDFHDLAKMVAKFVHFLIQDNRSVKLVDVRHHLKPIPIKHAGYISFYFLGREDS